MTQASVLSARANLFHKHSDQPVGAILVEAGRLRADDVDRILQLQDERGVRFGEAATALHLISQDDVDYALSRQFDYPYLPNGESNLSESVVAAYDPFGAQAEALRTLRSQILLRWVEGDVTRKTLAVISPARQEGRSFIAANLAVVFSQLGARTLLIDGDMRNSSQHVLFGLDNRTGFSQILAGRGNWRALLHTVPGLARLSVLQAGAPPPNPLELVSRPALTALLRDLAQDYDVILIDTPAAARHADAQMVASRSGAALVVARKNASRIPQVRSIVEAVAHVGATVVGTVLNG